MFLTPNSAQKLDIPFILRLVLLNIPRLKTSRVISYIKTPKFFETYTVVRVKDEKARFIFKSDFTRQKYPVYQWRLVKGGNGGSSFLLIIQNLYIQFYKYEYLLNYIQVFYIAVMFEIQLFIETLLTCQVEFFGCLLLIKIFLLVYLPMLDLYQTPLLFTASVFTKGHKIDSK